MPGRRNYPKKGYKPKKKPGRWANYKAGLGQLWSDVKHIKRLINVEIKHFDVNSSTTVSTAGSVIALSGISQGDTVNNRDGDSVKLMNNVLRFSLTTNASATVDTQVRMILFRGKQENAASYAVTDILESADLLSPKKYAERFRSKILFDRTIQLTEQESTSTNTRRLVKTFTNKLYGHVQFTAAAATVENGGLYLLVISNQGVNTPTFAYYNRLTYTDN